jgi:hypothetical protein
MTDRYDVPPRRRRRKDQRKSSIINSFKLAVPIQRLVRAVRTA